MTKDIKPELAKYRRKFGLQDRTPCTETENKAYLELVNNGGKLPDNVGRYKLVDGDYLDSFFTIQESNLTQAERLEYLRYKELEMLSENNAALRTIKNCVLFFTVPAVVGLVLAVLWELFSAF